MHVLPVDFLHTADSPRAVLENTEHLRVLAMAGEALPPIIVHRPTMRVIDGMHRLRAAVLRGRTEIEVRFFDGSEDDAFVLAVESNIAHGLPLKLAERCAAALRILASHPHWSDRAIAAVTGLSAQKVSSLRRNMPKAPLPADARVGRDGRVRPLSTAQARKEASRLLSSFPEMSLRQIARRTRLSPSTVRDVRDRMQRGEDIVPRRHRKPALAPRRSVPCETEPGGPVVVRSRTGLTAKATADHCAQPEAAQPTPDPVALYHRLCRDPALRQSEVGRRLLRLLSLLQTSSEEWNALVDAVPAHRTGVVADLALECARTWQSFADQVRRQGS
ncbi:ParB/RepB/Spo0J family partition protein [Streptomyces verrucosisporus]|uniref:ParB/RepB/Spo0J family partition protein n=1 Tax=Streptomyces verrucosisporus TaxID=1695161 RepID=UPI0027DA4E1E|nr:ParB N-terminal domain-containing protein [Streptomyces verrucosisporus]